MVVLSFITRNSYSKMRRAPVSLEDVLASTLQIPYRQIILVDDSTDETREFFRKWCEKYDKELIVSGSRLYGYVRPTRATARQTAIDIFFENFTDNWFMFVDDDVVLNQGWWDWILQNKVLSDPGVGEIWGINWDFSHERKQLLKLFRIDLKSYLIRRFEMRGGTHDTIYNRHAIEGVKIPPELHVYEDAYLHFWVKCAGWKSVVNPIGVLHYHQTDPYTDISRGKGRLRLMRHVAINYGICEYEEVRDLKGFKRVKAHLALIRPILGLPPALLASCKMHGIKNGFIEAIKRQYLKLWLRWNMLKIIQDHKIPSVCEAIRNVRA